MYKVILDTNVILSGVLFGGTPGLLLEGMQKKIFQVCISNKLYDEIIDKLINKFHVDKYFLNELKKLLNVTIFYKSTLNVNFPQDPDDSYLLSLCEESESDFLVTGDKKHLLPLIKWKNTKIISPKHAKDILLR